jgi:hypothetical protein
VDDNQVAQPAGQGRGPDTSLGPHEHGSAAAPRQLGPQPVVQLGSIGEDHHTGEVTTVVAEDGGQGVAPLDRTVDEVAPDHHLGGAKEALVEQPADGGLPGHRRIERHRHLCTFTEL